MRYFIALFFFLNTAQAVDVLKLYDGKEYKPLKVKEHQGLIYSESCFAKPLAKCEAYKHSLKKASEKVSAKNNLAGNPAARYCLNTGGDNRLVKSEKGEFDYCLYSDGTLVESWGLYNKFHPPSTIEAK